jgi:hypothetical protein
MEDEKYPKPRDLTSNLYHDFVGTLGLIGNSIYSRDFGKQPFAFTAQDCQRILKEAGGTITDKIEGLKQGKYYPTKELNAETLEEFLKFLQTFMEEGRMLTQKEVNSISDKFNQSFPKP